ncbi:response regulator transcription factor [Streptacidiphilus sp. NEAU-YB345]|uniref:Response regulator transcription factor n=1 Tax=Streptacidiphilus fuscans TaxID=2789292 RepID=A0A931BCK4_9ACTN|nr:response regulator transcription factor [Streptacidiphilus fuscans]
MVHVLVADDSELVRRGLVDVLESSDELHVVAQAWDGRSAVDAARSASPDVALVDIRMPGLDGLAATREMRGLPRPPRVLILTTFAEDEYVREALEAGASGFLLKDTPPRELIRAVVQVAEGLTPLDPAVAGQVVESFTGIARLSAAEQEMVASLAPREVELIGMIGHGWSNAQIAAALHVAEGTAKSQVSRLLTKIGAENRVQAARLAIRAGLAD